MLFKGNSSKLELLIEKIQANKEGGSEETGSLANEEVGVGVGSSWDVGSDGRGGSLSPASSRATPTSAGEVTDVEAAATLGVTSQTPYQCAFCDRAFPRLSYLKRHEQTHRGDASASTSSLFMALNNDVACSPTSKTEYKKDYSDSSTSSNVAVVWCTKPTILLSEGSFPQNSSKKVANPVSFIPRYPDCENIVVSNATNVCTSTVTALPQPLEIKTNEKKLYCYTSAGLVSKPAVFSASLSTNYSTNKSLTNQVEAKRFSKGSIKVDGMQCIVSSMTGSVKKSEGKRKVGDYEVTKAVERVVKHKNNLIAKNYQDNGNKFRKVEVCFPNSNKNKLNEKGSPLICEVASGNFKSEKDSANIKANLPTQVPIHSIVSLNSDSSKSKPPKAKPCTSSINQNIKNATHKNVSLEVSMPQIVVPVTSTFGEISVQIPEVITQKDLTYKSKEFYGSNEKFPYKISPNICVMPSSYVMNNTLGNSSVQTNKLTSSLQNTDNISHTNPPIPNISISLVSIKPVSVPVVSETGECTSPKGKDVPTYKKEKNINVIPQTPGKVASPESVSVNTVEDSINTEEEDDDDGGNGLGNVWVEEKMYSFVKEELRQLGDPVSGDGVVLANNKESVHQSKCKNINSMSIKDKDDPKPKDVSASTDSSGEIITEDVFSYIENELMRLDAMDDNTEPLNTSLGDMSSSTSVDSSVNDSGFCPSGMRTPDSSQCSRKISLSSSVISTDENLSLLSSKGSMDLHNITASSDNSLDVALNDIKPYGRRSTFSEFDRPNKIIKPRLRRFSISDSHGTLNIERSPGEEPLLCLKDLDSLKNEKSNNSNGNESRCIDNSHPIETIGSDELCKVEEKSTIETSDTDPLDLSSLEQYKDRQEIKPVSNNIPENVDTEIQNTLGDYKTNISSIEMRNDDSQIRKEAIENFTKKRSIAQNANKDAIDSFSKKSKQMEQEKEFIEIESVEIKNVEEKPKTNDNQFQCNNITNACTVTSELEFIPKEGVSFDLKQHLLLKSMDTEEISTLNFGNMANNSDIHSARKTLNVQIPLTHVQLSQKHYDVMSRASPIISNPETDTVNPVVNVSFHDFLSSPILKKIEPFHYQCTPPYANRQKQKTSPVMSPISPALPQNCDSDLPVSYQLPIITLKTPVSTNATTTATITTAASTADVFVTPPSFQSSSSSTVTLEETPSPPASIGSDSPYENQSVLYHNTESDCELAMTNPAESLSTKSSLTNNAESNYLNSNSYGEYLNSYLTYLQPQSLNDKVSDTSLPSLYLTGNTSIHSDLYTLKEETVMKKCRSQNTKDLFLSRVPYSDQDSKNLISNLGVFNSKNDKNKEMFRFVDLHNTIDARKTHSINSSVDIGHHSDQLDEMEFPKRLKDLQCTKISPSENNNETHESIVKNKFTKVQQIKKTDCEIFNDDLCSKVEEHLEENDIDDKLPSVHIQVRTGALAEQRGKSRAILSKLSQPLIHVGHKLHCKVAPKVILIRTGLNSPDSSPTNNETGKTDVFSDSIFDESYDRKFSAENLLYKSSSEMCQYMENDYKVVKKQNESNYCIYPNFENLCKTMNSNLASNSNLQKEFTTKDDNIFIGINNKDEIGVPEKTNSDMDHGCDNPDNEQCDDSLKKKQSNHVSNSDVNFTNTNEWKDSTKDIITKKSSKKTKDKKNHGKELRKSPKEKEIFSENNSEIEGGKINFMDKSEEFPGITNMKSIKEVKANFKNFDDKIADMTGINKDLCPSTLQEENEKEYQEPLLETGKESGTLVPDLNHTVHNFGTCSDKDLKEKESMFVNANAVEKTVKPIDLRSHDETKDWENTNVDNCKLNNKENSKFILDNSYKSQSPPGSVISTSNSDSIQNNSKPLINKSKCFKDKWDQDPGNVGNIKCITKVIEGTAMIRAAIRKKKKHAAKVKRNNIAKGRRKKAEKVVKKSAHVSKSRNKSTLKEIRKSKIISYSRDGEVFDPNNLSTVSGDALMAGITVHCTPEGVTLKLNCVENMDSETLKSGNLSLNSNKSSRAQSISKTKENSIATSPSKNNNKCNDKYPENSTTANQISSVDHLVNAEIPQSSLVSSNTEVTKSNKKALGMHVESIEESGKAITESVNPSKSVLELFEDFESLLGSMEDGDPETKSTSNCTSHYPVSQSRTQGIENTVTLTGSSSISTVVDCNKSVATNSLQNNNMTSTTTNTESSSQVVQMPSDNCNHNIDFSAAGRPLNVIGKINKTAVLDNTKKQLENCKFDVNANSETNKSTYNDIFEKNELSQSLAVFSKQERPQLENISLKDKNSLQERNCSSSKSLPLSDKYNNPSKQERQNFENISLKDKNASQERNCPSSKVLPLSDKYNNPNKQERLHFENITLKDKQARLQSENISLKDKNSLKEINYPSSKSLPLSDKYNNQNGKNFASKEIQINYKMPNMTKKCTFSLSKNENNTNTSHSSGKKSKRKNLFENKACQSNSITNDVYSRNSISQRESNSGFKEGKKKLKFSKQTEFNMQNIDGSKAYECKKDRNNNEFKHDHNYNSRRIKNKGKHKDLKVNSGKKVYSDMQNSNINHTKELLNPKMCVNQRGKLKNTLKQNIGSSVIDHATVTNKSVTEKELLTRESIFNVYKENNVIAVSKTSIMLNKNTKGKSNVPFEHETESTVKSTTCTDDSSNNLENLNVKKIKANVKVQKTELNNNECPTISLEDIGSDKFSSGFYSEKTFYSENKISLTDEEISVKSTESTPKASDLGSEESYFDTKVNPPIEADENVYNKLTNENEENDLAFPKQDFISNTDTNDNPQSSPDSPHFGLIHKLAQTSANSGYTKIVVKKVRSSSIDKKKSQGLLSSTLKRNVATRTGDLSGIQLQVKKNDLNPGKEFLDVCKENIISTKETTKIENSVAGAHPDKDNSKSNLSKCDSNMDHEKEHFEINSTEQQTEDMFKELFAKSSDDKINSNSDNRMNPLENLGAMVDKHLPRIDNAYTEFEQKRFNSKDLKNDSKFMRDENSSVISLDVIKEKNFGYSDITEAVMPMVHTFISTPEEKFEVKERHTFDSFSTSVVAHSNESGDCDQAHSNARIMGNLQPLDLRLERSEVPCAPDGTRLTGFSYSVDLDSGLVNVISTEGPEYTDSINNSEVLGKNGEIKQTNISATPTCISPVYAVQTVDNCSAAAVNDGPLIMPVYSVCETKALSNTTQVMQIYSYSAEDFSIRNYDSKSIYANAASISSVISPNLSITNTGGSDDGSLVVPVYSIASSNNINICNSDRLTENSAILETSQTLPVYLLNSFDSSNALPCTQISTIYTSNIVDESINSFPSEPLYGPQLIPIYSVETGNNVSNTAIGISQLNSTSENEGEIGNLHHFGVSDLSVKNLSGGNIVVNVEYVENITKSLERESLEKDSDLAIKSEPEILDHYVQKGAADISTSIISDSEHNNVDNIRESTNYDYVRNITEIGNLDDPESASEISNMECPENPVDTSNLEYGDSIKSEPEDDEISNTDIGSNHVGSEGGVGMDFLLLDSLTHADQLPFRCEFCGRLFKHKRSRDRHVKLHTGDKKYKCCHCEAAFSRSDHLKIHMKTHDTQKPYQCSVCNRGYNTAAALTAHMQNHKAKLTAHALNQLLKDAQESPDAHTLSALLKDSSQNPADAAALSQLLKEASSAPPPEGGHPLSHLLLRESPTDHHTLNHFLKDPPKEQLESPRVVERGAAASPGGASPSPGRENGSPASSPIAAVPCLICHVTCRNHTHLQRHMSRHHSEDSGDRPASRGGSGTSSTGGGVSSGVSSTPSTPSPRPPSSLPSPRPPIPNPFMFLVGGKLSCIYCSRDGFLSLEALQMHIQSQHSALLNGDSRDMANVLNLPSPLGSSLGAGGLNLNTLSPLAPSSSRGVTCELCGARVSGVTALQRHVVTAHTFTDLLARAAEGVFCAQCLLPFSNPGALAEHIKLVHASPVLSAVLNKRPPSPPNDAPTDLSKKTRRCDNLSDLPANTLLCSQCNAPFTNFEAFRRHLKTHLEGNDQVGSSLSGSQQLVCPECRLPLTSETALEVHLATHLGATCTEYGCQACLKLFQKPDELQKHLMDIHAHHLYRCALCKEMFDSKVSIQVHFAVKHSNECKVHKCTRCSLIFRTQSEFEAHVRSSHLRLPNGDGNGGNAIGNGSSSNGMYRCLLCTLSLSSEAELAAHVSTHQRQFHCSLCDDAFHVEFLLDKHMQSAHNSELNGNIPQPENLAKPRRSPLKKDLKCDICDADFASESALLGHRKQAHNIKNNSGNNNNNTKIAAAALSLFCAYCSEACKSRADLEIHMKSHQSSGGRHKCNICDELCPSASLLAQHKLSHIKVLSGNSCAVCREPLTSEHQFTSHQNEHHPAPLPQPCVVCRQTLVTDIEVNVHARFHSVQAAQAQVTSVASAILSSTLQSSPVITTAATACHTNSESNSRNCTSPRLSPRLRCPECNVKLETPEEAEAHAQVHQSQQKQNSSARTYQCIKCQESFASESEIEAHVASHLLHEGSTHECHLCRGTFDTPLRLQCHLIEHTFEGCGSFTCYMCSSVFTTAPRLQQHMVEHGLAARPYDCHHCHQKFFFRAELENHALSHPEATDGSCRECLASYPDLPRFHNRRPWPVLATVEATTAATRISPARPTQDGSPQQAQQGQQEGEEAPPSTNGHSNPDADPLEEEELQP